MKQKFYRSHIALSCIVIVLLLTIPSIAMSALSREELLILGAEEFNTVTITQLSSTIVMLSGLLLGILKVT